MKKFLYLKRNAIIGITVTIVLCFNSMSAGMQETKISSIVFVLLHLGLFGPPLFHNLLILFIYNKYYPEREIGKPFRTLNTILNILCSINLLIYIFSVAISSTHEYKEADKLATYMSVALSVVLCITTAIQIAGSYRLFKTIRENAQLQLEDSFV
jgi:hypothetical protein